MSIQGIVLAGGKSSRFGGDKALAKMNGETLLEKSVRLIRELGLKPTIITNETRDYSFLDCRIENDLIPHQGPLGGLYTACEIFKDSSLLVLTCDMPGVTSDLLGVLLANHNPKNSATLFCLDDGQFQPFPGIYQSSLSDLVFEKIKAGQFSMQGFLKAAAHVKMVKPYVDPGVLLNINRKEDLNFQNMGCKRANFTLKTAL